MKYILYIKEDKKVGILSVSPNWDKPFEELAKKDVPEGLPWKVVNEDELPKYNYFASSWILNDLHEQITFDYEEVKRVWLNFYRRVRTPLLAALDIDFMRSVESGDINLQKEIASKKQALRDVTKTELPNDLDGIKNTWPEILGQKPF